MSKQTGEAESVIKKVCKQNNSELIIPTEQDFENVEIDGLTTKVTYKASNNKEYILNLQALGTYQIKKC
mgnify:FL=1